MFATALFIAPSPSRMEAWQRQRNASGARIHWTFTTQKARDKLARAYPDTT